MEPALSSTPEKRRLKEEVTRQVKKWSKLLGLNRHQIRISWGPAVGPEDRRADTAYASSHSLSEYRSGHLWFHLDRFPPHEDVEQLVVHELVHFLLGPMQDTLQDFVEAVPENMQQIVSNNVERAVERVCTDVATILCSLVAGKAYGKLHFDEKELSNGHPTGGDSEA